LLDALVHRFAGLGLLIYLFMVAATKPCAQVSGKEQDAPAAIHGLLQDANEHDAALAQLNVENRWSVATLVHSNAN
jgi:hypothetical protein